MKYICDNKGHLVCYPYSVDGLHEMAKWLKIKPEWFHNDHYDIPKMRFEDIKSQCEVVRPREIVEIINGDRGCK